MSRPPEDPEESWGFPDYPSEFSSGSRERDLQDYIRRWNALTERFRALGERLRAEIQAKAGVLYEELSTNPVRCREILKHHPNPDVRWAALQILLKQFGKHPEIVDVCKRILGEETDLKIRSLALNGIRDYCRASGDLSHCHIFADYLYDDSSDYRLKRTSYFGILDVHGIGISERPKFKDFRFPDDVDWVLVATCLKDPISDS